jgi:hypothetical protein
MQEVREDVRWVSFGCSCLPPVITAPLLLPGPASARHGEARSRSYPRPPGASFCDCTPLPGNPCPRTLPAGADPATRCKRRRAEGPSRAHTAPVRARPYPAPANPAGPGHPTRLWPPLPQLAGHANIRHAAAVSAEPASIAPDRVRTEVPSGLAPRTSVRRQSAPPPGRASPPSPGIPGRQPARSGRRGSDVSAISATDQQVALSVTALE